MIFCRKVFLIPFFLFSFIADISLSQSGRNYWIITTTDSTYHRAGHLTTLQHDSLFYTWSTGNYSVLIDSVQSLSFKRSVLYGKNTTLGTGIGLIAGLTGGLIASHYQFDANDPGSSVRLLVLSALGGAATGALVGLIVSGLRDVDRYYDLIAMSLEEKREFFEKLLKNK